MSKQMRHRSCHSIKLPLIKEKEGRIKAGQNTKKPHKRQAIIPKKGMIVAGDLR
ncbi:hypothetical protein [Psychrobacter celer]|uniref:hypothetical protein n=1 Tax=Psychrobacter celer TaxID=306572 RepID=UPI003FD4765C